MHRWGNNIRVSLEEIVVNISWVDSAEDRNYW